MGKYGNKGGNGNGRWSRDDDWKDDDWKELTISWPEPPGPPGLMKRVALAAPSAGLRLSANVIAGPSGSSQSNGTGMSAHWNVPQSCHEILRDRYQFIPF